MKGRGAHTKFLTLFRSTSSWYSSVLESMEAEHRAGWLAGFTQTISPWRGSKQWWQRMKGRSPTELARAGE